MALRRSIQPPPDAPFQVAIGPARFFLDDIRDVHGSLLEFTKEYAKQQGPNFTPGTVEIRALTAVADEIEDLKEATRAELSHITLVLSAPKIRIDLWERRAAITAESESPMAASFVRSLKDFTASRHSWTIPFGGAGAWFLAPTWLMVVATYLLPSAPRSWGLYTNQGIGKYGLLISIALTVWGLVFTRIIFRDFSKKIKVTPLWRKEQRGLSSQTRTAITVGITCAVVAGVISFWAGIFVHN